MFYDANKPHPPTLAYIAKGLASLRTLYANITNQKHYSNEKATISGAKIRPF